MDCGVDDGSDAGSDRELCRMAEDETEGENGGTVTVTAPSVLLMEASSGKVLFEKDADTKRPPASVTKVMTILLIYDALSEGKIHKEDVVTVSEYAASMAEAGVSGGWGRADGRYTSKMHHRVQRQ